MTAWVEHLIEELGAFGVGLLMFLENLFPPIPSEVVLPLAGYRAAEGDLSLPMALLAGTIGSVLGVTIWYFAGRWIGTQRLKHFARGHGRLLTLTPQDIDHVHDWFDRHGGKAVLIGRLVPGVRTLISVPAGVSGMSTRRFLALTTIGTAVWSSALIVLGYFLGERFERASAFISPIGNVIIGGAILYYLFRVVTFRRHVERPRASKQRSQP
jgi:membrane protein DedA with SNARE-associated domain